MQRSAGLRNVASAFSPGLKSRTIHRHYASHKTAIPSPAKRRSHVVYYALLGLTAGAMSYYGFMIYIAAQKSCPDPSIRDLASQKDFSGRFEETADSYDTEVGISETLMGITRIRKKMAKKAVGHVLEVSAGTGRNVGYYDLRKGSAIESITFVDLAPQMIQVCKQKWEAILGNDKDKLKGGLAVRFLPGSALSQMPLAPASPNPRKYDTIIQTMGLCSTPAPVELIVNMSRYLDKSNPDARILLLEHGRSYQQWLNNILDGSAQKHAEIHGCWYNRDIGALVEEAAAKSGLEVVRERRHHLGTTWVFELKPKEEPIEQPSDAAPKDEFHFKNWLPWYK